MKLMLDLFQEQAVHPAAQDVVQDRRCPSSSKRRTGYNDPGQVESLCVSEEVPEDASGCHSVGQALEACCCCTPTCPKKMGSRSYSRVSSVSRLVMHRY